MTHSSIFSFEESSIWDPKDIRKFLCIPEDHLNILNSIPEWSKAQDKHDTFRIIQDSTIVNSQSQCSVSISENRQRAREQNTELFEQHIEERRNILKASKVYKKNLIKSASLFDIDKASGNFTYSSLRRIISLPILYHSSDISSRKYLNTEFTSDNFRERYLSHFNKELLINKQVENFPIPDKNTVAFESEGSKDLFSNTKVISEVMEVMSAVTENISTHVEKVPCAESDVKAKVAVENVFSSVQSTATSSDISSNKVSITTLSLDNANLVANEVCLVESHESIPCENNKSNSNVVKEANVTVNAHPSTNSENVQMNLNAEKLLVHKSCESSNSDTFACEVSLVNGGSISGNENVKLNLNAEKLQVPNSCESSRSLDVVKESSSVNADSAEVNEYARMDASALELSKLSEPLKEQIETVKGDSNEQSCTKEKLLSNNNLVENSCHNDDIKKWDTESSKKICDKEINVVANASTSVEMTSGKRKLESKGKRSKKRKTEEKQCNVKIRSIKKVGEVCYCVEDVKTMLDIMQKFL